MLLLDGSYCNIQASFIVLLCMGMWVAVSLVSGSCLKEEIFLC